MEPSAAADVQPLIDFLDSRLGRHQGHLPELQYECFACIDRVGTESNQPKLRVNPAKGKAYCPRCGYACSRAFYLLRDICGGKLSDEAQAVLSQEPVPVAAGRLADEVLMRLYARDRTDEKVARMRPVPLPVEYVPLWVTPLPLLARWGFNYITKVRGVAVEKLAEFKVGFCPTGKYAGRLVFPVYQGGRQVYFTTRFCGDHLLKSLNPENVDGYFTRNHCLLNYDACVGKPVIGLVEGPLDVMAGPADIPHAGTMGKGIAPEHIALLEGLAELGTKEIVLGTDPDASREAFELINEMSFRVPLMTRLPLTTLDPHDARHELPSLYAKRRPMNVADAVCSMRASNGIKAARREQQRAASALSWRRTYH